MSIVGNHIPAGKGAREKILDWEREAADYFRDKGHLTDINRHAKP